jgi:hypothetical protein
LPKPSLAQGISLVISSAIISPAILLAASFPLGYQPRDHFFPFSGTVLNTIDLFPSVIGDLFQM